MSFADAILTYYRQLSPPDRLPANVTVMNPYENPDTYQLAQTFYKKYYHDSNKRFMCFGINPGRFGAGQTGVPFTDPVRLDEVLNIPNDLPRQQELSSKFIYEMIASYGGPEGFYSQYYISAVSPLGYLKDGINLNYYDIQDYKSLFEKYATDQISIQLQFGVHRNVAFSIGMGQNVKFLNELNKKYQFFGRIVPLPHPRWVMQYRLKRKMEFIKSYLDAFAEAEATLAD